MCIKCNEISERIKIEYPHQYYGLIEQLLAIHADGSLTHFDGNCKLTDIQAGKPWPDDYIYHRFQCNYCGRVFNLTIETYHGIGGHWDFIE